MDVLGPGLYNGEGCPLFDVKMYWYKREGTSKCVLYREAFSIVSFIQSPLSEILLYNLSHV